MRLFLKIVPLLLLFLIPLLALSGLNTNPEMNLSKPVMEANTSAKFEDSALISAPQEDSLIKKKHKRKGLSEKNKKTVGKIALAIHIVYTVSSGVLFFMLLYAYNDQKENNGCLDNLLLSLLYILLLFSGITFGALLFALILHLIARHILKKSVGVI